MKNRNSLTIFTTIFSVLACFGLAFGAEEVSPAAPDSFSGSNTFDGFKALGSQTANSFNSAFGWESLASQTTATAVTGCGAGTLVFNTADNNTAVGAAALEFNGAGTRNVAVGGFSLLYNTTGADNTAVGLLALEGPSTGLTGVSNNAMGRQAASSITTGSFNQAIGVNALLRNDVGNGNIAIGDDAGTNITGNSNVTVGSGAFGTGTGITTGNNNAVLGNGAGLGVTLGSNNVLLGTLTGSDIHTTSGNVYIGAGVNPPGPTFETNTLRIMDSLAPVAGTDSKVFIGGISGAIIGAANALVGVNANGQLGTLVSSARYKKDIESMGESSEMIFSLRPVSFHYKGDETNLSCFGLIAEEVAKVNRDLILLDKEGKPFTVRYEQINAMLLNEFLKEHKKVEAQQASISQLKSEMQTMVSQLKEQAAQIQKVSAQVEVNKPAPQVVVNKP
jgi:trimeric autotransporter adhesin